MKVRYWMVGVVVIWTMDMFQQPVGTRAKNVLLKVTSLWISQIIVNIVIIMIGLFGIKTTHVNVPKANLTIGRAINVWNRVNDANNPL